MLCVSVGSYTYVSLCAYKLLSYQHDHTPVEDSSVVTVTTGRTQQGLLCLMTATEINKYYMGETIKNSMNFIFDGSTTSNAHLQKP